MRALAFESEILFLPKILGMSSPKSENHNTIILPFIPAPLSSTHS